MGSDQVSSTLQADPIPFTCKALEMESPEERLGASSSWCLLSEFYQLKPGANPPRLRSPFIRMYEYLSRVAPTGRLPGRQHIDPLDFHEVLTFINLVDVIRDGAHLDFRFRLVGTTQTIMARRDITGQKVQEAVVPQFADRIVSNQRRVAEIRTPLYDRFAMPHPNRQFIDSERVYYPLAADGETVDMLLILNGYYGVSGLDPFDKKK